MVITTVLGSSVLAGLLSAGANYFLDVRREKLKSLQQIKLDQTKEKLKLYDSLNASTNEFKDSFNASLVIFRKAAKPGMYAELSPLIKDQANDLLKHIRTVEEASVKIGDKEISELIRKNVESLTVELSSAFQDSNYISDPARLMNIIRLCDDVSNKGIDDINNLIEKKRQGLYLQLQL